MPRKLLLFLSLIFTLIVFAGNAQSPQRPVVNKAKLLFLKEKLAQEFIQQKQTAVNWAQARNYPIRVEFESGKIIEIQDILNGRPRYYVTDNLDAAKTVSTDDVWPGGSAGLSLNGNGLYLGEWDGGGVLLTHQEFGGRVSQMDNATYTSSHSTHVAGTLIASGVDSDAKGMAGAASLHAYEWNNDESEMANAAANGLLISNHSYSYITGWIYNYRGDNRWAWFGDTTVSAFEDYSFGFYSDQSQEWDEIAYNAPYYLIVKSAGNDRNDTGPAPGEQHWVWDDSNGWVLSSTTRQPDGGSDGFDCIPAGGATAKNILTIGAVMDIPNGYTQPSDVVMTEFSSWGPTDDGRIKPDIVANGSSLYSCDDGYDSDYTRYSGTSMASPNTAGSLILLQQHYQNTHNGALMRAATLKALVIHTADEAGGAPGPDYSYGWGLLNTQKAAKVISADVQDTSTIQEMALDQGDSTVIFVQSEGMLPLKVTIAWTDPPANAPVAQLNSRVPMLVNNLDLRVTELNSGTTYLPWKLSPDNPSQAAVTGDNVVDTEEQVYLENPVPGNYRIVVRHSGTLQGGSQDFSIIITGVTFQHECVPPYIKVGDVSGQTGDTLSVPILIEKNSNFIDAFGFKFHYCSDKLSYLGVQAGDLTAEFDFLNGNEVSPGTVNIGGFDPVAIDTSSSGTLVYVLLQVDQCSEGETCALRLSSLTDDIVGLNNCEGTFTCQPACERGDVNMDGDITPGDALCAFQIYLQGGTPPEGECNTECAIQAGDANCDSDITPGDALIIFTAYLNGLTPPLDCPPATSLMKHKSTASVRLVSLPTKKNDELKIGIRLGHSAALQVFGLDVGFSEDALEFISATSGNATKTWQAFGSYEILSGVLRIGGFHGEANEISEEENLVELTFRIKNPQQESLSCWVYNLEGDIAAAEVETFTFENRTELKEQSKESRTPQKYHLSQNFPNPFNMETMISYEIPEATQVAIRIYNLNGQVIKTLINRFHQPGSYQIIWNGKDERNLDVVSGLYFFSIDTKDFKKMRKMTLIK